MSCRSHEPCTLKPSLSWRPACHVCAPPPRLRAVSSMTISQSRSRPQHSQGVSYETPHISHFQLDEGCLTPNQVLKPKPPMPPPSQLEEGYLPPNQDLKLRSTRLLLPATRKLQATSHLPLTTRGEVAGPKSGPRATSQRPLLLAYSGGSQGSKESQGE